MGSTDFWTSTHASSAKDDWRTPRNILDLVRQVAPILLDPCTDASNPVGAAHFFTPKENGLGQPWHEYAGGPRNQGLVFVNPPYGRGIGPWIAKCRFEAELGEREAPVIALPPARPDTAWWQDNVRHARAVCFWRGRLTFGGAPNPAPFPSALIYWGIGCWADRFCEVFEPHGWVIRQ